MNSEHIASAPLPLHLDAGPSSPEPEAVSINETCRLTGIGRSKLYQLIGDGTLPTLKVGKRRLVRLSTVRRLLASLEHVGSRSADRRPARGTDRLRRAAR
ncbi:MAG TPA: helix-turn-helix domain-containing protein [Geminicoccaceae bacterium]|nr:helix-turn-helix domain-containing protein [Geminicoccaceae bacterium]